MKYAARAIVLILAFAINTQAQELTRDSPTSSVTTYQNHTVTFAVWASGLSDDQEWDHADWYIDGWNDYTASMSGQTDYVSYSKKFETQGVYQVSVDAVYFNNDGRLVDLDGRTGKISWTVYVNSTDPYVTGVSPDSNVTVKLGSTEIFHFEARDPGGDLWRGIWYYDGVQATTVTLSGSTSDSQTSFTFDTPGTHEIKIVVWDSVNFTAETSWQVTVNQPPIVNHGGPYAGTVYQSVQFDGSGSTDPDGTIVSYYWEFGDGSTGTGARPSHTYTEERNYTVALVVTDNDGATAYGETSASIGSIPNRLPNADPGGPYYGHVGQAIQFDGSGSEDEGGTIVSYLWNFGDGTTGTGMYTSHTYAAIGQYTVTLTVTDDDGATHTFATTSSINNTLPVANHGGPYTGPVNVSIQFNGSGSYDPDGTVVSYEWDFGDGSTGTGVSPSHSYSTAGTYTVTLKVTDDVGGYQIVTTTVIISQADNQLPIADAGGPYSGQVGQPVQFDGSDSYDPDGTIVLYDWNFGDGSTGTGVRPTHTYSEAGTYGIQFVVTDNNGALNFNETFASIISTANQTPIADSGGPYEGFVGQPVQFDGSDSYDLDGTIVSYDWVFGDGTNGSGVNSTHIYTSAGTYTVELTVRDDDSAFETATTTVVISQTGGNKLPVASSGGPYSGQVSELINFSGSGSYDPDGTIVSYEWDFGDGTHGIGVNPTHTYAANGNYTAILLVTDNEGASETDTTTVTIGQTGNQSPIAVAGGPYSGYTVYLPVKFDGSGSYDPDGTIVSYQWDFGDGHNGTGVNPWNYYESSGEYTVTLTVTDDVGQTDTDTAKVHIESLSAPEVNLGGPYEGQVGEPVQFDGSGSYDSDGFIASYEWDFGDGTNATGVSPTHIYTAAGTYTVSLTVYDDDSNLAKYSTTAFITESVNQSPNSNKYLDIAAGKHHNLALKADGSIIGWGKNDFGQADTPPGNDYIAIAAGADYSMALKTDGTIIAWGDNTYGLTDVPDGSDFIAIAAGSRHGLALRANGSIIQWGDSLMEQGSPPEGNDFVDIAAGHFHSLAIKSDGSVVGWGRNRDGQADPPEGNDFTNIEGSRKFSVGLKSDGSIVGWGNNPYLQTDLPNGIDFIAVDIGREHGVALKTDGSLIAWGNNEFGQTEAPEGNDFIAIAAGGSYCLALKVDGTIVGWGSNDYGQAMSPSGQNIISISTGYYHSIALKANGSIVGWGSNEFGQADSPEGNDFIAIAAGAEGFHNIALRSDGSIVGWGDNQYGQASPPEGNDFVTVAAGSRHSLALKSDGSIITWGDNSNGQADAPAGNDFISVAAGTFHSIALKSDGSIVAWGRNVFGQSSPPAGNDFVAIAAGGQFSLALKTDGSIVGWGGKNTYGQASPPAGNDFVAVSAGKFHALALKSDGTIVGWGDDEFSQATGPVGNDFIAIAAGGYHSIAIKADGTIVTWGDNQYGQAIP